MRSISGVAFAGLLSLAAFAPVSAQRSEDFNWSHAITAGKTIEIKGVNGGIKVVPTSGSDVRVKAEKRSKKSNVTEVKIEVVETPRGYAVCAVYPTPARSMRPGRGRQNECTFGDRWNSNVENNDVEVEWTVEVPRGVLVSALTTNGDIDIQRMQADVSATTVNGDVDVTTTGLARANTVNGSIDVSMGRNTWERELKFTTVNGGISVAFPGDLNTQVSAETVNGDIDTDWPLTVRGRFGSKNLNGTIGTGGRMLALSTVNGSIEIRKK